jgi:hypothetical protein
VSAHGATRLINIQATLPSDPTPCFFNVIELLLTLWVHGLVASKDAAFLLGKRQTIMSENEDSFPIDMSKYQKISLDPFSTEKLSPEMRSSLLANIQLCRDAIIFFTACGTASG